MSPKRPLLLVMCLLVCAVGTAPMHSLAQDAPPPPDYMAEFLDSGMAYAHHRFRAAAGADMVMDRAEFIADREREGGAHFVRPFDTLEALAQWDADRNGRIDWLEAARYRVDQATRLAEAFERQGDGRWGQAERAQANAALADGLMPGEPPELTRRQARAVHAFLRETLKNERHIAMEQNFEPCDVNRDGVVTRAEAVRTMVEDDRHFSGGAEAKRAEALATFNWWDSDKDGRVGPREIRSAYAMRAARAVQAFTERLARVDRNGDGRISRAERLAEREQFMLDRFERQDTDGDGRLSPEEAIVPTDHAQANAAARKLFRKKDADGDGYVSRAEAIAHFRRNTRR